MQAKPEAAESFRQHIEHAPRVVLPLADHDKIIRVADELGSSQQARLRLLMEPCVEDLVQIDVSEQGGDDSTLRRAALWTVDPPILQHSGIQPLVDHAAQHAVCHPSVEEGAQVFVVERVEERLDIDLSVAIPKRRNLTGSRFPDDVRESA